MRISIPFKKQVNKQKVKEVSGYVLKNPKFGQKKKKKPIELNAAMLM